MILKILILIVIAFALIVCYAAIVVKADADELEEEYWREQARKKAREEKTK